MGGFKIGDRVQLKSGGGALTVAELSRGRVDCASGGSYEPRELRHYDPQHDPFYAPLFPPRPPFKVGDSVRLKSGGPAMTVDMAGDHYVACVRRDAPGVDTHGVYHPDDLRLDDGQVTPPVAPEPDSAFRPGDVVRLKSGGPAMTVLVVGPVRVKGASVASGPAETVPGVSCVWFAADGVQCSGPFAAASVRRVGG